MTVTVIAIRKPSGSSTNPKSVKAALGKNRARHPGGIAATRQPTNRPIPSAFQPADGKPGMRAAIIPAATPTTPPAIRKPISADDHFVSGSGPLNRPLTRTKEPRPIKSQKVSMGI